MWSGSYHVYGGTIPVVGAGGDTAAAALDDERDDILGSKSVLLIKMDKSCHCSRKSGR
jgi:hypothetical protein